MNCLPLYLSAVIISLLPLSGQFYVQAFPSWTPQHSHWVPVHGSYSAANTGASAWSTTVVYSQSKPWNTSKRSNGGGQNSNSGKINFESISNADSEAPSIKIPEPEEESFDSLMALYESKTAVVQRLERESKNSNLGPMNPNPLDDWIYVSKTNPKLNPDRNLYDPTTQNNENMNNSNTHQVMESQPLPTDPPIFSELVQEGSLLGNSDVPVQESLMRALTQKRTGKSHLNRSSYPSGPETPQQAQQRSIARIICPMCSKPATKRELVDFGMCSLCSKQQAFDVPLRAPVSVPREQPIAPNNRLTLEHSVLPSLGTAEAGDQVGAFFQRPHASVKQRATVTNPDGARMPDSGMFDTSRLSVSKPSPNVSYKRKTTRLEPLGSERELGRQILPLVTGSDSGSRDRRPDVIPGTSASRTHWTRENRRTDAHMFDLSNNKRSSNHYTGENDRALGTIGTIANDQSSGYVDPGQTQWQGYSSGRMASLLPDVDQSRSDPPLLHTEADTIATLTNRVASQEMLMSEMRDVIRYLADKVETLESRLDAVIKDVNRES